MISEQEKPLNRSVVLVGMPGSGKSTLGVLLARRLAYPFLDTDLLIQERESLTLQQIVDARGYRYLRQVEEDVLLSADLSSAVVATGGSAVYSAAGMERLGRQGIILYLDVPLGELLGRVADYEQRGIARRPGQSFESLFEERKTIYERYADVSIDCGNAGHEQVLEAILEALRDRLQASC